MQVDVDGQRLRCVYPCRTIAASLDGGAVAGGDGVVAQGDLGLEAWRC